MMTLLLASTPTPAIPPSPTPADKAPALFGFLMDLGNNFLTVLGVVLFGVMALMVLFTWVLPKRRPGFATARELKEEMGRKVARQLIPRTRPSLEHLSRRELRQLPITEYAVRIGVVTAPRRKLWGTPEDTYLILGPSRASKSTWLNNIVFDAPGAVIHTSSKPEDHLATKDLRAQIGPVYVFNPDNVGGVQNTLEWSPIDGCENPKVAMKHGGWILYGARKTGDTSSVKEFFESQANEVLRCLFHAAALGGKDLRDVQRWANDPTNTEALRLMREHDAHPDWIASLAARQNVVDNTRDGIFATLSTALEWVSDPDIAAAVTPTPGKPRFNGREFLTSKGTIYMLGKNPTTGAGIGPLFATLCFYLVDLVEQMVAEQVAEAVRNGDINKSCRLDPPLTLALDECATICPIPLWDWLSKLPGIGVQILAAIQSRSQLASRWGRDDASSIWNNAAFTLVLRGIKDIDDLETISVLCGEYEKKEVTTSTNPHGTSRSTSTRTVRVLPTGDVRKIGKGEILVLYRGASPTIIKVTKLWMRRDVLKRRLAAKKAAKQQAAAPQQRQTTPQQRQPEHDTSSDQMIGGEK